MGRIEAVELGDAEAGSGEGPQGRAVGMAAAYKELPERNGQVLRHASQSGSLVADVFYQEKRAVRAQNAAQFPSSLLGIVDRAHHKRANGGVEAGISEG